MAFGLAEIIIYFFKDFNQLVVLQFHFWQIQLLSFRRWLGGLDPSRLLGLRGSLVLERVLPRLAIDADLSFCCFSGAAVALRLLGVGLRLGRLRFGFGLLRLFLGARSAFGFRRRGVALGLAVG